MHRFVGCFRPPPAAGTDKCRKVRFGHRPGEGLAAYHGRDRAEYGVVDRLHTLGDDFDIERRPISDQLALLGRLDERRDEGEIDLEAARIELHQADDRGSR